MTQMHGVVHRGGKPWLMTDGTCQVSDGRNLKHKPGQCSTDSVSVPETKDQSEPNSQEICSDKKWVEWVMCEAGNRPMLGRYLATR